MTPRRDDAGRGAMATIRGQCEADRVVAEILAGHAAPAALGDSWSALAADRHAAAGFARAVQKALERRGGADRGVVP